MTDAQKEAHRQNQNELNYFELENKYKQIKETCQEQDKKLAISDNLLEEITISYDNLSLRTRIVIKNIYTHFLIIIFNLIFVLKFN